MPAAPSVGSEMSSTDELAKFNSLTKGKQFEPTVGYVRDPRTKIGGFILLNSRLLNRSIPLESRVPNTFFLYSE